MDITVLFYTLLLILSAMLTAAYVFMWHKHFNVNLTLIFAFIPVVNLGHVFLAQAYDKESVLMATKITYLGGCFLILFITLYIFKMCQIEIPRWLTVVMLMVSMIIYSSVLTSGKLPLFYKEVNINTENGVFIIEKEYGIFHTLFYVMLAVYFVMSFSAIIYSFLKKKNVSRRITIFLFVPEVFSLLCLLGGKILDGYADRDVELVPVGFVVAQIMYLFIAHYTCLYDVTDMAIDSLMETGATGFISFDLDKNYLGSNDIAADIFKGIEELTVDKSLDRSSELWHLFSPWIEEFKEDESKSKHYYNHEDHIYLVDINHLFHDGKSKGFQFVITDDTKNQKYIELIDNYNSDLEREVGEKTLNIVKMHNNLIRSMAKLVESRDNSTGGHIIRTSDVVELLMNEIVEDREFSDKYHIDKKFVDNIIKAAPLHDIGKIAVDDDILKKPGRFTDEEFEKMKSHAAEGAKVLDSILDEEDGKEFKNLAENVAHYHHERMDGSGYPDGLSGEEIPMEARIMAIADVYDALVSKRVYKESMSFEKANAIMMESMGKHFDKKLEKFYILARPKIEAYYTANPECR